MARSGAEPWLGRLDAWLAPFLAALPRAEQRRWASLYVRGLLLPGERKSVEPMAARVAPGDAQQLHHLVPASPWPHERLEQVLAERADRLMGGADAVLVVDDTALVKQGRRVVVPGDNPTRAMAAATGFVSTAADLARFFGRIAPEAPRGVLSAASRREMVRRHWHDRDNSVERHYGLGVTVGPPEEWEWFGHSFCSGTGWRCSGRAGAARNSCRRRRAGCSWGARPAPPRSAPRSGRSLGSS